MAKKIDGGTVVVDGKGNMKQLNKELDKTSKGFNTDVGSSIIKSLGF